MEGFFCYRNQMLYVDKYRATVVSSCPPRNFELKSRRQFPRFRFHASSRLRWEVTGSEGRGSERIIKKDKTSLTFFPRRSVTYSKGTGFCTRLIRRAKNSGGIYDLRRREEGCKMGEVPVLVKREMF